jgi:hypothetical protein
VGPLLHRHVRHAGQLAAAPLQLPLVRPHLRSRGLPPSSRQPMGSRDQLVQPTLDIPPRPRPKITPIGRRSNSHRTILARQTVVPTTKRAIRRTYRVPPLPRFILSGQARSVRGRRTARVERHGFPRTAPASLYRTRGSLHLTLTNRTSAPRPQHTKTSHVKYRLVEPTAHTPWHASMRNHVDALVGTNDLGDLVLDLLTGSLPTTYNNYGTGNSTFYGFLQRRRDHPTRGYRGRHASLYIMARPGRNHRGLQPPTLLGNKQVLSRPPHGASGTGTNSNGRTSETRHAATAHHRPRHSRTNPSPHRTTDAPIRPPTLPRANLVAGQPRTYQDCYFCRAETGVRCHMDDIAVDRTGRNILLFIRKAKGDHRRTAADKALLQLPIIAVSLLADLMEALTARRTSYCNQFGNGPGPTPWTHSHYLLGRHTR